MSKQLEQELMKMDVLENKFKSDVTELEKAYELQKWKYKVGFDVNTSEEEILIFLKEKFGKKEIGIFLGSEYKNTVWRFVLFDEQKVYFLYSKRGIEILVEEKTTKEEAKEIAVFFIDLLTKR